MICTIEYAPGRLLDVHGDGPVTVLLWHGRRPNDRTALAPLAASIVDVGHRVIVPDWDSTAPDGGRRDLLLSVRYVRELGMPFVVAGHALGATAAASLAINARRLGLGMVPAVCLDADLEAIDPISGQPFEEPQQPKQPQPQPQITWLKNCSLNPASGAWWPLGPTEMGHGAPLADL